MDRKAWIILTVCGILLALNFYFRPTPPSPAGPSAKDDKEQTSGDTPAPPATGADKPSGLAPTGGSGLVAEPHIESVGENTEGLTSKDDKGEDVVEFTFTSHGGGIKTAELLNQFAVGSHTQNVLLNKNAPAPIGAIFRGPDEPLGLYYTLVEKNGNIYCQNNPDHLSGLQITKLWSLEQDKSQPGAPWRQ